MFDWNDEELANIIWGEAEQRDDHIVPYSNNNKDCLNKKEQDQDVSVGKLAEKKPQGEKHEFPDLKLRSTSRFDKHGNSSSSGLSMDTWPHLGSSDFIINGQESINSEVSNDVMETDDSGKCEASQHHRDNPMFENAQGEEDTDYAGYGWENIGSFDDLDRIFSNDEPLFGNVLGNADYEWPSNDVKTNFRNSPNLRSEALTEFSDILQAKSENVAQDDLSCNFVSGKVNDPASLSFSCSNALLGHTTHGDRSKTIVKGQSNCPVRANVASSHCVAEKSETINELSEKVSRPKKQQKGQRKREGKIEMKSMRDVHEASWPTPSNSSDQYELLQQATPSMSQLRQMQGPHSFCYHYPSYPYLYVPTFDNVTNPYPVASVSHSHSGVHKGQAVVSCYEASRANVAPVKKQLDSLDKPPTMSPQEKIEKLKRRQQMQAMLAIQKQQEQFGQQVCSSAAQESPCQSQMQLVEGSELELDDTSPLPSTETSPAVEQGDSSTISVAVVDYAAEEIVLRRLQDVIAKLDSRIRLCIRDSLFRLAKSAEQRNYTTDTSSRSKKTKADGLNSVSVSVAKEIEINPENNVVEMADVETDTNPIDRTVAHLLFHRPLETTVKHPAAKPDSPLSENKVLNAANKVSQTESHQRPGSPNTHFQKDAQQTEVLTTSASANTSMTMARSPLHGDDVTMELEASQ